MKSGLMQKTPQHKSSKRLAYFFGDGKATGASERMITTLGNKGCLLHDMTMDGFRVPAGFTIPTYVCEYYFENRQLPPAMAGTVRKNIRRLEKITGYKFGDAEDDPLLVSARSGAAESMPGMMETILNIGLTDKAVSSYIQRHGDEQSKWYILDCQRRLYEMFGENVFGIKKDEFRQALDGLKTEEDVLHENNFSPVQLEKLVTLYKALFSRYGRNMPQDPFQQLVAAVCAVEESAMGEKARNYRKVEGLPEKVYTAVTIQTMVYGNKDPDTCCTGVGFTRDPSTGKKDRENPFGEFLAGSQGEDVVSGRRTPHKLAEMRERFPDAYSELMEFCDKVERKTGHIQDYEFTVYNKELYILQRRNGKLTGRANVRSSLDMARENIIEEMEAVLRITPQDLEQLLHRTIDYDALEKQGISIDDIMLNPRTGIPASPGCGVGRAVFDVQTALSQKESGEPVVLCRIETDTADYIGMVASEAIVTSRGGKASHAAVVARNKGIPCAVGTGLDIDEKERRIIYRTKGGETAVINEGEFISVDGSTGKVLHYKAELREPNPDDPDLIELVDRLRPIAKMRVYANANDAEEARRALKFGAEGVGLARTEYMFLKDREAGENRALTIQSWVLADDDTVKTQALQRIEEMQKNDFLDIYNVMEDMPVIIRLLDYPFHELLSGAQEHVDELSEITQASREELIKRINSYREINPMLGHRSVRLGITHPEMYRMQVRAVFSAALDFNRNSGEKYVTPYIEVPLVSMLTETEKIEKIVREEAEKHGFMPGDSSSKGKNRYKFGIMYELAGACYNADELAGVTDFGSFGTNDLTQTTKGWSREDGDTTFLPVYIKEGIVPENPFITIDKKGPVSKAMMHAVALARSTRPDYELGICGEHAADPASLEVCYGLGLNNVSPGPNQVPIAWLRSAQLSLTQEYGAMAKAYAREMIKRSNQYLRNQKPGK